MKPLVVAVGSDGRLHGEALAAAVANRSDVGIVVASAGSTNAGLIDDLDGAASVAASINATSPVLVQRRK